MAKPACDSDRKVWPANEGKRFRVSMSIDELIIAQNRQDCARTYLINLYNINIEDNDRPAEIPIENVSIARINSVSFSHSFKPR